MGTTTTYFAPHETIPEYFSSDYFTPKDGEFLASRHVGAALYQACRIKVDDPLKETQYIVDEDGFITVAFIVKVERYREHGEPHIAYKHMTECCGPCYYDCPLFILDKLSELTEAHKNSERAHAYNWRQSCREATEQKRNVSRKRSKLVNGTRVKFATDLEFRSGTVIEAGEVFQVINIGHTRRKRWALRYSGKLYHFSGWQKDAIIIEDSEIGIFEKPVQSSMQLRL